ncbi:hypothetical protein MCAMS1_00412 [biofilm metagenome]
MAKEFIQKIIQKVVPNPEVISQHKNLQFLGDRLKSPNLWHINRRSINAAIAIGLFFAWAPTPTQMAFAAAAAVYFRANLLVSVATVWVTNPITMPPLFYFAYRVGLHFAHRPAPADNFVFSLDGLWSGFGDVIGPFLLGCLLLGLMSSLAGYIAMDSFWRYQVSNKWEARKRKRVAPA